MASFISLSDSRFNIFLQYFKGCVHLIEQLPTSMTKNAHWKMLIPTQTYG